MRDRGIRRLDGQAGGRLDPDQVILHRLDAGYVFGSDFKRLALAFVDNYTPQLDHAVMHHDVGGRRRRPLLFLYLRQQMLPDSGIVLGGGLRHARQTDHGVHELGARDNPDHLAAADDRHAFDAAALHQVDNVFDRRDFIDGLHFGGHHFGDLAAVRMAVFGGDTAGTHQEFEPARAPPLGLGLTAALALAFRQHAYQIAVFVDHRQAADVMLQHHI